MKVDAFLRPETHISAKPVKRYTDPYLPFESGLQSKKTAKIAPKIWGKILQLLPAVFMLIETVILFYWVFTCKTRLFSALSDFACLLAYFLIIRKQLHKTLNQSVQA